MRTSAAIPAAIIASCGAIAHADSRLTWHVSTDGFNFSESVSGLPGDRVVVRAVMSYSGSMSPIGLASCVFQPTVSNWDADGDGLQSDRLLPFINGGAGGNLNGTGVVNPADLDGLDGPWGRVSPWGRSSLTTSSALRGHIHNGDAGVPPGTWLRIAQSHITSWFGGDGNTSGTGGVLIAQLSNVGRTTFDPAFNSQLQNIVVFQFAIDLSADIVNRTMIVDSPPRDLRPPFDPLSVYWFASLDEATGTIRDVPSILPASIVVIPAPGAIVPLALLVFTRLGRRRNPRPVHSIDPGGRL